MEDGFTTQKWDDVMPVAESCHLASNRVQGPFHVAGHGAVWPSNRTKQKAATHIVVAARARKDSF